MEHTSKLSFLLLLTLGLTIASGCAGLQHGAAGPSPQKPRVDVTAVTMEAFSRRGVGGQLEMTVLNPSPMPAALRYIEWEMSISGDRAVVGRIDVSGQIPANTSAPVSAALEVLAADADRVVPHLDEGLRDYELHGVLHYKTAQGDMSVGFQSSGTL